MRLNEIRDRDGARKSRLRIGRGIGSGMGITPPSCWARRTRSTNSAR